MTDSLADSYLDLWISGQNHQLAAIELYPEERVLEWRKLTNQGAQLIGPISTGIGFIGSAGWVAAGSLALGAIESVLTSASQKEGLRLLNHANAIFEQFRTTGRLIPIYHVARLELPNPGAWRGKLEEIEAIELRSLTRTQLAAFNSKRPFSLDRNLEPSLTTTVEKRYLSVSEEFITGLDRERGRLTIRWSSVDAYKVARP